MTQLILGWFRSLVNTRGDITDLFQEAKKTSVELCNCLFNVIRQGLPVDLVNLAIYNSTNGDALLFAYISPERVMFPHQQFTWEREVKNELNESLKQEKILYFPDSINSNIVSRSNLVSKLPDPLSVIAVASELSEQIFSLVNCLSIGANCYSDDHLAFLKKNYVQITDLGKKISGLYKKEFFPKQLLDSERKYFISLAKNLADRQIIGSESGLKNVMRMVKDVAPLNIPVLITGETGVGKELIAQAIHLKSSRSDRYMSSINCAAIPDTLIESELFGYEKGAFTGASDIKVGYFENANGGTVFLDEIGELSLSAQTKLLRVLQTMEIKRIGGNKNISVNVRLIAATNRNIPEMIRNKEFRSDLWYRISIFPIHVPPLRERLEDVPALLSYISSQKYVEMGLKDKPVFAECAIAQLQSYDWPGNVRELTNVIERALILYKGTAISFPDLNPSFEKELTDSQVEKQALLTLDEMIKKHILRCLVESHGKIAGKGSAAEILGMHPSTLRAKIKKLGIRFKL